MGHNKELNAQMNTEKNELACAENMFFTLYIET